MKTLRYATIIAMLVLGLLSEVGAARAADPIDGDPSPFLYQQSLSRAGLPDLTVPFMRIKLIDEDRCA
jgi:hypothetical protein